MKEGRFRPAVDYMPHPGDKVTLMMPERIYAHCPYNDAVRLEICLS